MPSDLKDRQHNTILRLAVMLVVGAIAAVVTGLFGEWPYAATVGWCFSSAIYSVWVWMFIRRANGEQTKAHASREELYRGYADLLVILLTVASLFAVVFVLVNAANSHGVAKALLAALTLLSVALSWILLHTLYTLRYARQYYSQSGGVDFNQKELPRYYDFAYLAFTLGMTYQVSDTSITTSAMRATALKHALLSFVFGAVIVASTINLLVQITA
ncbi:DUF1345 domain-containing protein [Lacisediminihabitans changchengi]|uniref:DUF1345 domain-containing protein n=1 Tax=Lacisediminihabitans changchengi TaxID=2787634 RepID=A0A934SQ21_9MICO|nr:DUF1345 domain-containing protein [Lacisediminihabitans changchengi]MBK4346094.1 DUF1345 domain-containing protein [Lacisediminihabitans changchengi]